VRFTIRILQPYYLLAAGSSVSLSASNKNSHRRSKMALHLEDNVIITFFFTSITTGNVITWGKNLVTFSFCTHILHHKATVNVFLNRLITRHKKMNAKQQYSCGHKLLFATKKKGGGVIIAQQPQQERTLHRI